MSQTQEATIAVLDAQTLQAELYAKYWIAMATTGIACDRIICDRNGPLTPKAKTKEALDTALRHIHTIEEIMYEKTKVLELGV